MWANRNIISDGMLDIKIWQNSWVSFKKRLVFLSVLTVVLFIIAGISTPIVSHIESDLYRARGTIMIDLAQIHSNNMRIIQYAFEGQIFYIETTVPNRFATSGQVPLAISISNPNNVHISDGPSWVPEVSFGAAVVSGIFSVVYLLVHMIAVMMKRRKSL